MDHLTTTSNSNNANGFHQNRDNLELKSGSTSLTASSSRQRSLIVCTKKRWSITSSSSIINSNSQFNTNGILSHLRQQPSSRLILNNNNDDDEILLRDCGSDTRLGAQSAPALLSNRISDSRRASSIEQASSVAVNHHTTTTRTRKTKSTTKDNENSQSHFGSTDSGLGLVNSTTRTTITKVPTNKQANSSLIQPETNQPIIDNSSPPIESSFNDFPQGPYCSEITSEPIVQLKDSSASSSGGSAASSRINSCENLSKPTGIKFSKSKVNNNNNNDHNNDNDGTSDEDQQEEEQHQITRSSSRIIKRRTIKTRRTHQSSKQHCEQEQEQQEAKDDPTTTNACDINNNHSFDNHYLIKSSEKTDLERCAQKIVQNSAASEKEQHNNTSSLNKNINGFFRTRQIGSNQTSSSSSSSKISSSSFKSSTSTVKTTKSTQVSSNQQQEQKENQQNLVSCRKDSQETCKNPSPPSTTNNSTNSVAMLRNNNSNNNNKKSIIDNSGGSGSTPISSSFPFEIEKATGASFEQIAEAESHVSHRESFSSSVSSSLRSGAILASKETADSPLKSQLTNQQRQQLCNSTSSSSTASSSNPSTLKAADQGHSSLHHSTTSSSLSESSSSVLLNASNQQHGQLQVQRQQQQRQHQRKQQHQHEQYTTGGSSSTSSRSFQVSESSSSAHHNCFHMLVSSPDVRSLAQEIGTDFANLESCLTTTRAELGAARGSINNHHPTSSSSFITGSQFMGPNPHRLSSALSSRLFGSLNEATPLEPPKAIMAAPNDDSTYWSSPPQENAGDGSPASPRSNRILELMNKAKHHGDDMGSSNEHLDTTKLLDRQQEHERHLEAKKFNGKPDSGIDSGQNRRSRNWSTPIKLEPLLIDNALSHEGILNSTKELDRNNTKNDNSKQQNQLKQSTSAAMNQSIERIEHKLSDICRKLDRCQDLKQAIELLEVLIQMIEKAWSVPVCGDDLGFRLCNCFRDSGGLYFILGLIRDAHDSCDGLITNPSLSGGGSSSMIQNHQSTSSVSNNTNNLVENKSLRSSSRGQLRLSLPNDNNNNTFGSANQAARVNTGDSKAGSTDPQSPIIINNNNTNHSSLITKDSDSETIMTSDLGLDSASVESFSYTTSTGLIHGPNNNNDSELGTGPQRDDHLIQTNITNREEYQQDENQHQPPLPISEETEKLINEQQLKGNLEEDLEASTTKRKQHESIQRDDLIFLSARLLSQCLTTNNRDYLVENDWLEPVVRLACTLAMIKSSQAHKKLLLGPSRFLLARRSSTYVLQTDDRSVGTQNDESKPNHSDASSCHSLMKTANEMDNFNCSATDDEQQAELLAAIGSEILQHLFKHSEDTCTNIISMGGLEAILFGCRSSSVETLRHCAPALTNLALHGGPDCHEMMIEHKAHVWLFPLAFNEDDNVQYYACLAIVILVANQEIEADVLKSSTLNLVEPFVTSHEPRRFAESDTAHIHGQSASWLSRLIPLLDSKREEARNLAAFHFAMEAYVKREQGQTYIFRDIGAIEPLRKLGSSPNAIASKFACQALRLIGEKEPHRLSQQVPLWTNEDVIQWVSQINFKSLEDRFRDSGVDGDLLLQLDELMLERDIGIRNGITRRRFLRELAQLKRISDYTSLDETGLCSLLGQENLQYAYPMLKFGVTRDNIHQLDADHLLEECGIPNTIHRSILSQKIKCLQEKMAQQAQHAVEALNGLEPATRHKTLDVFVSYRRSTGSQLASLLKVHLQLRNFSVFIDVERLEAGKFDNNLLDSIRNARNFILVLSPNALDRCIGDFECKDWIHKEIVAALTSDCNIIPIMDNFQWPDPEKLPEDMRSIAYYNGVPWIHDYQDACVDKIERFIRGELSNTVMNSCLNFAQLTTTSSSIMNYNNPNTSNQSQTQSHTQPQPQSQSICSGSLSRHQHLSNQYVSPTPSVGGPLTPLMNMQQHSDSTNAMAALASGHPLAQAAGYHHNQQVGQSLLQQQNHHQAIGLKRS